MPFRIVRNDITKMTVDAIVNAANSSLLGGGGVDGAIHAAAGPQLLAECRTLGGCEPGHAKITKGYNLPAKYVIHTVGPIWNGGGNGEEKTLRSCYAESLKLASEYKCGSIAFPLISAGVYGYPKAEAIAVANSAISAFLAENDMDVYLVVFDSKAFGLSKELSADIEEYISQNYVDESEIMFSRGRDICCNMAPIKYEPEFTVNASCPQKEIKPVKEKKLRRKKKEEEPVVYGSFTDKCEDRGMPSFTVGSAYPSEFEIDESFMQALFRLIDEKGMTDVQCYKQANIDRKYFSKMKSKKNFVPTKRVALSFAVGLRLSLEETNSLLEKAGFVLSNSSLSDVIIKYFIEHKKYDFTEINTCLFEHDLELLGS